MNIVETGKLLTIAGGFDRFITVDQITTTAWHMLLADTDYKPAETAVLDFYQHWDGKGQLTVAHILDTVKRITRTEARIIAIDVGAARAHGLIAKDWDEKTALPSDVAQNLADARAADRAEAQKYDTDDVRRIDLESRSMSGAERQGADAAWYQRNREWLNA